MSSVEIDNLIIGNIYTNKEICETFKCSLMKGMAKSNTTNTLVLVAKHTKNLYDDRWIDDILHYTGEGQEGDQTLTGQNKTLYESVTSGIKVYLFEVFKETEYIYQGEVYLVKEPYKDKQIDKNGTIRNVWMFPIKRADGKGSISLEVITFNKEKKEKLVKKLSDNELNENIKKVNPIPGKREVTLVHIERDSCVSEKTKRRANGICDLCKKVAPFQKKDGSPFLETHHVITLANNGPDQVYNTVALCPNCHRKIHVLENSNDIKILLDVIYNYLLLEGEKEFIGKFNELFEQNKE